jgi:hypothetical protein
MLNQGFPATLRDRRAWPWLVLAMLAFIAGVWLRLWQLRTQVLIDDEWHAVRMLIGADAKTIATHFGYADYCIPLTLYYRWLYDHGALSEWQMHLPLVIAGIATLIVLPWLMRDRIAWPARAVWIALLAISPLLVYFSRTARPYALDCVCAFVAIIAFERWQRERRVGWAVAYAVATIAAAWLHLLTIVFTLWPFVWFGLPALREALRRSARTHGTRELVRIVALAVATVAGLALVLLPPVLGDWRAMAAKAGAGAIEGETLYRALLMMFGISSPALLLVMTILLALGIWRVWTRDRRFTAYVLSMSVAGVATIALSHAAWVQHALTLVRYSLPVLPFVLLFLAEGIAFVVAQLRLQVLACGAASLAVAGLVAAGPIPRYYYFPNQLMGDALFQLDYAPDKNPYATLLELGPVPQFYRDLASRPPGTITLIETPSRLHSNYFADVWYQAIHRQNVKYALAAPDCGGESDEYSYQASGTAFRRIARLGDLLDGATWGADYLVLRLVPWSVPPGLEQPWPDMATCAAKVEARLGEPVYRDAQIVVFALKKK